MITQPHHSSSRFKAVERIKLGNRLLRRKEVEQKTGKSRSAIYEGIRQGTFPAPVPIGENSVAWLEEEVDGWIAARLEERNRSLASLTKARTHTMIDQGVRA
ncbi:helix-turn-helix transcriptional regulator [Halomonas caseinilytica]|uniref:helix-turn-helix transcriptional regulator n=1 Tax=Halomonas caseinilytica TaxID=438744 RepID=UPI0007E56DCB|nr:AlpA family transcriptional regulator [Halomonas caseinilytica]SEM10757.1 transcriptional regulator, AlpA family [Halomonas caseinilytica]